MKLPIYFTSVCAKLHKKRQMLLLAHLSSLPFYANSSLSIMMVIGPSLTSSHAISAPNTPGALVIDNSSAYRLKPQVPLVIPQINREDIKKHQGLIANPNCTTIIALMAAAPLHRLAKIKSMVVSTYQAVSAVFLFFTRRIERRFFVNDCI